MRRRTIRRAGWLLLLAVLGWMGLTETLSPALADSQTVPGNARSRAAIRRAQPRVKALLEQKKLSWGAPVFIRIFKQESRLELWLRDSATGRYRLLRGYPICAWSGHLGPKQKQGDHQAPEGFYTVRPRQMNPSSSYHLSFNLGYPNRYDRAHGRTGDYLMVHSNCVSIGCYAMGMSFGLADETRHDAIEEIWTLMDSAFRAGQKGIPVHIFPFPLTEKALAAHSDSPWTGFWTNLKEGYELFEQRRVPPGVRVAKKRYVFNPRGKPLLN